MTELISIWAQPVCTHERERGGVDDLSTRSLVVSAFRLSTIGVLLVGLGMLVASPHPSSAQGTCTLSNGTAETLPDDNPPEVTKTDEYDEELLCQGLLNGLKLTLNEFNIGTSDKPTKKKGIEVTADGAEEDDVTVMGDVIIHSTGTSIDLARDGTGLLKLQLDPGSEIKNALSGGMIVAGIYLRHKGEANTALDDDSGINLVSSAEIDVSKSTASGKVGIIATTTGAAEGTTIPIKIDLKGGFILAEDTPSAKQSGYGVRVTHFAKGDVNITVDPGVMIGMKDKSIGRSGIEATIYSKGDGNVMIMHSGHIYAVVHGIYVSLEDPGDTPAGGDVKIETGADSEIVTSGSGGYGIGAVLNSDRNGAVEIIHRGTINAAADGIYAYGNEDVTVTLEKGSSVTAKEIGIRALAYNGAKAKIETKEGSSIIADRHGIQVDQRSLAKQKFNVTIRGMVMGGDTEYAGLHILGGVGGTIVIGPRAHVSSVHADSKKKVAIKVDTHMGANPVTIILEEDEAGVVGHVEGQILNPVKAGSNDQSTRSTLQFKTRSASGADTELKVGNAVYRRGKRVGVYDQVFKAQLEELDDDKGYQFKDVASAPVLRLYSHRARLYEVLPSVLLGLVDLTPYSTRMAVPRRNAGEEEVMVESSKGEHVAVPGARTGVWVRLAVRDGERMADTSTTAQGFRRRSLAWDIKQTDFEAGLEVPTDERLVLGVNAHYRQSEATVRNGGTIEASGTGVGVSLTWTDDSGLYVDGQLSYARFSDVALMSNRHGMITSTGKGNGLAFGVEVGQPMSMGDMTVIPRGGLSWSSVDMDAFNEPTRLDGAGLVTPGTNQSVRGRVGVLAELGPKNADRRLYASVDLEHEFSSKHAVMVAGTRLATEVKPTWVRLGVGGAMSLGDRDTTMLTGDAFYATAGSDNTHFGGGLSVTFRF